MQSSHAVLVVVLVAALVVPLSGAATAQTDAGSTSTGAGDVTFVEADVEANTTWTPADGPYRLTRDVTVARGATLTLAPGTEVQLAEGVTVTVDGSIVADGTEARPVRVGMTPGAPAGVRWDSIRYAGGAASTLALRNTSVRGGTNAITVASERGSVSVADSTVRNHSEGALRVAGTGRTPSITVRGSTVRDIGGHALQVAPGFGAVKDVRVTASPNTPANRSVHTLSFAPGVPVTTDEIRVDYGDYGDLSNADFADLTVDTDDDPAPERRLAPLVSSVERRDDALVLHLDREVSLAGDSRLTLEYRGVRNPTTKGVYPVSLQFERNNVSQLANGVVAPLTVGDIPDRYVDIRPDRPTRVSSLTVRESTFTDIDGAAVFGAADRVADTTVSGNRISSVAGTGIALRAHHLDAGIRDTRIEAGDAGVALSHRNSAALVVEGVRVTDSATGVRIRQSGAGSVADLELELRENTFAENERHGVDVRGENTALVRFRLDDNAVTGNGGDGVVLDSRRTADGAVVGNRIADNGGDGFRSHSQSLRGVRIADNALANNGGDGIDLTTRLSARNLDVVDNRVRDGGGHGVRVRTELVVHRARIDRNRLSNNGGAGLLVSSPVTHGGRLNVTNNTVAANTYGVLIEGALRATLAHNDVVFNTNGRVEPVPVPDVRPGTGVWVGEGPAGAVLRRGATTESVADLIADPTVDARLSRMVIDEDTAIVLRTDRTSDVRSNYPGALSVRQVAGEIPTGIALATDGDESPGFDLHRNDVYGQERGLAVDIETLIDASTSARVVVDQLQTVRAAGNYWGASTGPYHTSILPSGGGNPVVTEHGWVDFVPFEREPLGEPYARPRPRLDVPASATPGETVTASAARSTSTRHSLSSYHFTVGANALQSQASPRHSFVMPNQSVTVRLAVEDTLGIDSAAAATATVTPRGSNVSAAESPSAAATTTTDVSNVSAPPGPSSMSLLGGALGAIPSLAGFALGLYGVSLSLRKRRPPVSGFTVQGLVIAGVLVWMVAGLLTDPLLLRIGVGTALVWMALTAVAYLVLK